MVFRELPGGVCVRIDGRGSLRDGGGGARRVLCVCGAMVTMLLLEATWPLSL